MLASVEAIRERRNGLQIERNCPRTLVGASVSRPNSWRSFAGAGPSESCQELPHQSISRNRILAVCIIHSRTRRGRVLPLAAA